MTDQIRARRPRFAQVPEELLFDPHLSDKAKTVYGVLDRYAEKDTGRCWPMQATLAERLGCDRRTIARAIDELVEAGWLSKTRTPSGNIYVVEFRRKPSDKNVTSGSDKNVTSPCDKNVPSIEREPLERESRNESQGIVGARRRRPQDDLWDALTDVFGPAETETARGLRGKVVRSLMKAGATADEIRVRSRRWPALFDDATFTELALEKHWTALGRAPMRASPTQVRAVRRELDRYEQHRRIDEVFG